MEAVRLDSDVMNVDILLWCYEYGRMRFLSLRKCSLKHSGLIFLLNCPTYIYSSLSNYCKV